jgi:hypothetical protein
VPYRVEEHNQPESNVLALVPVSPA